MSDHILHTDVTDGVLRVIIDREEKRNALSRALLTEIGGAFSRESRNESLRLAVITGAGQASFAAGGDLKELKSVVGLEAAAEMAEVGKAALNAVRHFPVPVIAALNGDALGGGAELAVACDIRVAANHARIGFIQGRMAISTAWGGGTDLVRLIGFSKFLRLMSRSEIIDAQQALSFGLVDAVASDSEDIEEALERFMAPIRAQSAHVLRAFKALCIAERHNRRDGSDAVETRLFAEAWAHPDHDAALEKFLSRRGST